MGDRLQVRRGTSAQIATIIPEEGEPIWDVASQLFYIGDGETTGGILIGPQRISVLDQLTTPPVSPSSGDKYIVTATATGSWTGQENKIAFYNDSTESWHFVTPPTGTQVLVADEDIVYIWDGTNWETLGEKIFGANSNVRIDGDGNLQLYDTTTTNWKDAWLENGNLVVQATGDA
jgi:hypothetical protein